MELICNNIPTLLEIREKKLTCVVHTKSKTEAEILIGYIPQKNWKINLLGCWNDYAKETGYYIEDGKLLQYSSISFYKAKYPRFGEIYELEEMLEPVDADGGKIAYAPNGAPLFWMSTPEKPVSIEEQLGLPKGVSIHDLPTSELIKKEFNVARIDKIALPTATETKEMVERVRQEILRFTNAFPKEEKKLKFTFYVTEGTRVDKSCNGTIPTMTTMVSYIDKYGCIMKGTATCDKTDYDERQGVLEAFANATCGIDFYKAYAEAVKEKKHRDIADRTCTYCGKVCDTIEDKNEHEAWHVECRKARHERYLLRKRAKEIAFEEAAQKLAKEMIKEDK